MSTLGRLTKVELREIWKSEAQHFTPWLANQENVSLLSEALGIDLEVEAVEQSVGPFRADILCKDTLNGNWVLIENQLERTDHTHLGQLITYAAGLDAVTIIWISARVADEHRKACDWLNEVTSDNIRFFALEVELWRIGDSAPAPKFNIVSQPNAWGSTVAAARKVIDSGGLSETRQLQMEYWTAFESRLAASNGPVKPRKAPSGSWVSHGIGKSGVSLNTSMNTFKNWIRVELYLSGGKAKANFDLLSRTKSEIEAIVGQPLDWQLLPEGPESRICLVREGVDPRDRQDWNNQHKWLLEALLRFHAAFQPFVWQLNKSDEESLT